MSHIDLFSEAVNVAIELPFPTEAVAVETEDGNNLLDVIEIHSSEESMSVDVVILDNLLQDLVHTPEIIDLVSNSNVSVENESVESGFGSGSSPEDSLDIVLGPLNHAATPADVMAIEHMLETGSGVFSEPNCVLNRSPSLLRGAGYGIFLNENAVIEHGMCITEYDGDLISSTEFDHLSSEDQLYGFKIDNVLINGLQQPVTGRGLGSFFNSVVAGRCLSFVRPVVHNYRIFFMCNVCEEYPLVGPIELYFTAGIAWWKLYRRVLQQRMLLFNAMHHAEHLEDDDDV